MIIPVDFEERSCGHNVKGELEQIIKVARSRRETEQIIRGDRSSRFGERIRGDNLKSEIEQITQGAKSRTEAEQRIQGGYFPRRALKESSHTIAEGVASTTVLQPARNESMGK